MKPFIIMLFFIFFFTSFSSMLLWHYSTHSYAPVKVAPGKQQFSPDEQQQLSPDKQQQLSPDKQQQVSPNKQQKVSPDKQQKLSPDKQQQVSPDKQQQISPDKKQQLSPDKQQQLSPDKQQQLSPDKQQQLSPNKQQISPDKQQQVSPNKQQKVSPDKQQKLSPDKQQQVSPDKQQQISPDKKQQLSPDKQQQLSPDKQQQLSPNKQQISPDKQQQISPDKQQQLSPDKQQQLSPNKQQISPDKQQQLSPDKQQQISPDKKKQISPDKKLLSPDKQQQISPNKQKLTPGKKQQLSPNKQQALPKKPNPASSKKKTIIEKLLANYTSKWKRQEENINSFRSLLANSSCKAISNAVVTQENSPVGANITYEANRKKLVVTPDLFSVFPKESPFKTAPWDTCAVVGNGGVLANSSCGEQIDSATFVIRCNLPPLSNGHERDTGRKTNLVTANPSILFQKYNSLNQRRRRFVEDMQMYGDASILLPAFSYGRNTAVSLRALYTLEDFSNTGPRAVFFNPQYLKSLAGFWRGQGIQAVRLSTGIMMASLALELCNNVHLYGFWPFETHPYTYHQLSNHYYDNQPVNKRMHAMPAEFQALLNLHNKGVIHLHLEKCTN